MKSLRSSGSVADRARRAQVLERAVEVRALGEDRDGDRAAALVGARRSRPGRRPRAACPAEGERRLNSAITPMSGPRAARRGSGGRLPARAPVAARAGLAAAARACAAATSSRVSARIRSSTVRPARCGSSRPPAAARRVPAGSPPRSARARSPARPSASAARAACTPSAIESARAGRVDRGARVDQRQRLARRSVRARALAAAGSRA